MGFDFLKLKILKVERDRERFWLKAEEGKKGKEKGFGFAKKFYRSPRGITTLRVLLRKKFYCH